MEPLDGFAHPPAKIVLLSVGRIGTMKTAPEARPRLILETSAVIAYVYNEPAAGKIERLLTLAEAGEIALGLTRTVTAQIRQPTEPSATDRLARVLAVAVPLANVARLGDWVLGANVLGSDNSPPIDANLKGGTNIGDKDVLIAFEVHGWDVLVNLDKGFTKEINRRAVLEPLGLRVMTPGEALAWLSEREGRATERSKTRGD